MKRDSFRLLRVLFDANYKKKSKKEKEKKGEGRNAPTLKFTVEL